jgi:hypothetical protein
VRGKGVSDSAVFKQVDTCAAEFDAETYLYSCYDAEDDHAPSFPLEPKVRPRSFLTL